MEGGGTCRDPRRGKVYGSSDLGRQAGSRWNREANPTGPLHVGHGPRRRRGDIIANIQKSQAGCAAGIHIKDAGHPMDFLVRSTQSRTPRSPAVRRRPPSRRRVKGGYIYDTAGAVREREGDVFFPSPGESLPFFKTFAADTILDTIQKRSRRLGWPSDVYFSERPV